MGARGVHFALSQDEENRLLVAQDDDEIMEIIEEIEEEWKEGLYQETDSAWAAIHRCLGDGTLDPEAGSYPLNKCILGGRQLYESEDYFVSYINKAEASDVANALQGIDEGWLRARYFELDPDDYGQMPSEEDFEYTWSWFEPLKDFFQRAAKGGRSVIFTVDQ